MKKRINDNINEIEKYLQEMYSIAPDNFEEYKKDFKTKAACERYFEKIIESIVDLCFILIKEKGLKMPEDDEGIFETLSHENMISDNLAKKLRDAKGMRNIIAHEYGSIDDSLIFESVATELKKDVEEFIKFIDDYLEEEKRRK